MIDLTTPEERAFLIGLDDPSDGRWPVARSLVELAGQHLDAVTERSALPRAFLRADLSAELER